VSAASLPAGDLVPLFDEHGIASLDGTWEFFPGDHGPDGQPLVGPGGLDGLDPVAITVPGLWEAQGHLELDGVAWYRRAFVLDDVAGHWSLRFGAVMDLAEVYLNGSLLGASDNAFLPFVLDPEPVLLRGRNVLAVRVTDPSVDDPEHLRLAHGKQGWANHVFPSRPSLYMTYGGIWQPVTLRRHGALAVRDAFANGDPDDLAVVVEVENVGSSEVEARVGVRAVGVLHELTGMVPAGTVSSFTARFGATVAEHWRPGRPVLHRALVDVMAGGGLSDRHLFRFGLRTVRVDGNRMFVDGEPFRMRSALVQGFRAEELYAEGPRHRIVEEVEAAQAMGFNMLRLHIKAFDPTYLDVCDELGMLVHCDIPVAEPIAHEEMGTDSTGAATLLTRRCAEAAEGQVRRDRNHPSVVLWSAMNELCFDRQEARAWPRYEDFARVLVAAVRSADPTRPVIENDWPEPDPDRVFAADVLTAHWYGRLHADYLEKLEGECNRWSGLTRPLFVTEFGDWGLPDMPVLSAPPFWDTRGVYAAGLAATLWPATVNRFVVETQRYQGLSDRLQAEVFRRHDHIGGYCVTELTDVPRELNGLLDLYRCPKPIAVEEVGRANQPVLPMLQLDSLVAVAGASLRASVHVANDGPALSEVEVEARFGDSTGPEQVEDLVALDASGLPAGTVEARFGERVSAVRAEGLAAHRASRLGEVELMVPDVPGGHDLIVRLSAGGTEVAENRYPLHVVAEARADVAIELLGGGEEAGEALRSVGAALAGGAHGSADGRPAVVGEGALDGACAGEVADRLRRGRTVVILAQRPEAAPFYPVDVAFGAVETIWGSTEFIFTTDHGALASLPRRNLLVAEDSTIQARDVFVSMGGGPFPDTPVVIAYKPVPGARTGTVVGSHAVGQGRLIVCQYRLAGRAAAGDAAARALLVDLLRWAAAPLPQLRRRPEMKEDGRRLTFFSLSPAAAQAGGAG
jgi:hypothetical protein